MADIVRLGVGSSAQRTRSGRGVSTSSTSQRPHPTLRSLGAVQPSVILDSHRRRTGPEGTASAEYRHFTPRPIWKKAATQTLATSHRGAAAHSEKGASSHTTDRSTAMKGAQLVRLYPLSALHRSKHYCWTESLGGASAQIHAVARRGEPAISCRGP